MRTRLVRDLFLSATGAGVGRAAGDARRRRRRRRRLRRRISGNTRRLPQSHRQGRLDNLIKAGSCVFFWYWFFLPSFRPSSAQSQGRNKVVSLLSCCSYYRMVSSRNEKEKENRVEDGSKWNFCRCLPIWFTEFHRADCRVDANVLRTNHWLIFLAFTMNCNFGLL